MGNLTESGITKKGGFRPFLAFSLCLAVLAPAPMIYYSKEGGHFDVALDLAVLLSVLWIIVFIIGLVRFRKRGLWQLVGAPFALFCLFGYVMIMLACIVNQECL